MPAAPAAVEAPAPVLVGFHTLPRDIEAGYHGHPVERVDHALRFAVVRAQDPHRFAHEAASDANVRYARVDDPQAYHALALPDDPLLPDQWGWARVRAPAAWNVTRGSPSIVVAVLDTGIDRAHPDFDPARVLQGYDFPDRDRDPDDVCGHGTHTAGTIGATTGNGLGVAGAAQATLLPVKVLNDYCGGSWSDVASGIRYAADQGARVISMSLGCGITCFDQATADAVDYAWGKGALLVAAAGNDGPCSDCLGFPAKLPHVLAVGCTDPSDALCSFSSQGAAMLTAPGLGILSTTRGNGYGTNSGTSMSAPHVAGAAALALSVAPQLTNQQLRDLLASTAADLGAPGQDATYGFGRLDMGALIAAVGAAPAPARSVAVTPSSSVMQLRAGSTLAANLTVTNTGQGTDTFALTLAGGQQGWRASLSASKLVFAPGASSVVKLTVKAPRAAAPGSTAGWSVTATSSADASARAWASVEARVV